MSEGFEKPWILPNPTAALPAEFLRNFKRLPYIVSLLCKCAKRREAKAPGAVSEAWSIGVPSFLQS